MSAVWATKPSSVADLSNTTFGGTLRVIEYAGKGPDGQFRWKITCDSCGLTTNASTAFVRNCQQCPDLGCRAGIARKPIAIEPESQPIMKPREPSAPATAI